MPRLAHREVMLALARKAEARLGGRLLPSEVPGDVTWFGEDGGAALGSVDVRRGAPGSSVRLTPPRVCVRRAPSSQLHFSST
jgi:red chlorophyll catabolite reductase